MYGTLGPTLIVLIVFVYLCWLDGCCGPRPPSDTPLGEPDRCSPPGEIVAESRCLRLVIFMVSVVLISACTVISLVSILWTSISTLFTNFKKFSLPYGITRSIIRNWESKDTWYDAKNWNEQWIEQESKMINNTIWFRVF